MKKIIIHTSLTILFFITTKAYALEHIPSAIELFEGKTILITGGTGYLGRTLASALIKYNPATIILASRDEVKLFQTQKLFDNNPKIKNVLTDVRDYQALLYITKGVDIVIHAAALKRMDVLEYHVEESIKTNILGTLNLFHACVANKVKRVVFISTDKACSPINAYGACKFVSEKIFTNYDNKNIDTIFTVIRFGNILESTGSVIPIFLEKIKNRDDIPLTNPAMTRFIISKDEAVEFIINSMRYAVGGEIFVQKLPALTLLDLLEILKEKYQSENTVKIIGIRPGEKIHEVLINTSEMARTYEFQEMLIITPFLDQWLKNLKEKNIIPSYITKGRLLSQEETKKYSSKKSVLSRDALKQLFIKLNVLENLETHAQQAHHS